MQSDPVSLPKAVILISGNGSNLQAIIDAVAKEELPLEICLVVSNIPSAFGLTRADEAGIETKTLDHKAYESRAHFDAQLIRTINNHKPDVIVLAGFMRILSNDFVNQYLGKLINIHPSLLPKYPGLDTHQRALDAGDKIHGVTTHFVTPELDAGPNIVQAKVEIRPSDSTATLASRIQEQEHIIYPITLKWFAEGRLRLENDTTLLDGKPLPSSGLVLDSTRVLH